MTDTVLDRIERLFGRHDHHDRQQETIMSAIDDLTAIVTKLATDVAALEAKASVPPADDPAVVAAVAALTALDATLNPPAPVAPVA